MQPIWLSLQVAGYSLQPWQGLHPWHHQAWLSLHGRSSKVCSFQWLLICAKNQTGCKLIMTINKKLEQRTYHYIPWHTMKKCSTLSHLPSNIWNTLVRKYSNCFWSHIACKIKWCWPQNWSISAVETYAKMYFISHFRRRLPVNPWYLSSNTQKLSLTT